MRRRCLAVVAISVLIGVGLGACDTDDGREMREPTEQQRSRLAGTSTTTTTTSTTTLPPTTPPVIATVAESAPDSSAPDSSPSVAGASVAATDESAPEESAAALVGPGIGAATGDPGTGPAGLSAPWADGGPIGAEFTCDGAGVAPLIEWIAPPEGTTEMALTVVDDDANGYVHWAVFGLPAAAGSIGGEGPITAGIEGRNSKSGSGWTGPCPPPGTVHEYRVTVHFLGQQLEATEQAAPSALVAAIEAVSFDEVTITGTYERAA